MSAQNDVVFRELEGLAELKASEDLQRAVWGEDDLADNADLMLSIQHEGGLVAGAFHNEKLVGFLFAFPSREPDIQHSHRLAVHPDGRSMGLGQRLKWFQRDWCLARDIKLVRWTYDPLRWINASLNIDRLGATAGTYHTNYYGEMPGINAGIPSDRLLVEWELLSDRVAARAQGRGKAQPSAPVPEETVEIPRNLDDLLASDRAFALSERLRVRGALMSAFDRGLRITGFDTANCRYHLSRP